MRYRILATGVTLGLVALVAVQARQTRTGDSTAVMALTAMDYIQIKQLVNRYAFALDTASRNGYDYADLFSRDGVSTATRVAGFRDGTSWRRSRAATRRARCT
jgi:hypothetical protein